MAPTQLVRPDARNRVSLGDAVRQDTDYRVTRMPDGSVVLDPVVIVSQIDARLAGDAAFWSRVAEAQAHPREDFELDDL